MAEKSDHKVLKVFLILIASFVGLVFFVSLLPDSKNKSPNQSSTRSEERLPWYQIPEGGTPEEDKSKAQRADFLFGVYGVITEYDITHIKGLLVNNTGEYRNYVQITFSLYDESGSKVDTCLANVAGLGNGEQWDFDAACFRSGSSYKIDNIVSY